MRTIRAVLTTIGQVITAPFRLIARMFGGRGDAAGADPEERQNLSHGVRGSLVILGVRGDAGFYWYRVADGKLCEHWATRDDLSTILQLGVIQPPGPPPSAG